MSDAPNDPGDSVRALLDLRLTATLGTLGDDGSILMTPIWYLYEDGLLYLPTGSGSRKVRNVQARPGVTVLIDQRRPECHRWASATGSAAILGGAEAKTINDRVRARYLTEAGEATYGRLIEGFDDVALVVTPTSWRSWNPLGLARVAREHGREMADVADWFTSWD
jgi:PPOX class probable F420-dependent enzyme